MLSFEAQRRLIVSKGDKDVVSEVLVEEGDGYLEGLMTAENLKSTDMRGCCTECSALILLKGLPCQDG